LSIFVMKHVLGMRGWEQRPLFTGRQCPGPELSSLSDENDWSGLTCKSMGNFEQWKMLEHAANTR